jgi:hypothetical protein
VETILSLLTRGCHLKRASQWTWTGPKARLAYTLAVFNILELWGGIRVDDDGTIHLSIAQFTL